MGGPSWAEGDAVLSLSEDEDGEKMEEGKEEQPQQRGPRQERPRGSEGRGPRKTVSAASGVEAKPPSPPLSSSRRGRAGMTPAEEDLWDTSSLYRSQLNMEDLLWTDWFNPDEKDDGEDHLAQAESMMRSQHPSAGSVLRDDVYGHVSGSGYNDIEKRILCRTQRGMPRARIGHNLLSNGLSVALWCDTCAARNRLEDKYGRGQYSPTRVVQETEGFVDDLTRQASQLGIALAFRTMAPVEWHPWQQRIASKVETRQREAPGEPGFSVDEMFDRLRTSGIIYKGLWGLPMPHVDLSIARITRKEGDGSSGNGADGNQFQLPTKIAHFLNVAQNSVNGLIGGLSRDFVREGTDFILDWKEGERTRAQLSDGSAVAKWVDIIAIAPVDCYGKRASIKLGRATGALEKLGESILESAVLGAPPACKGKNYISLGLGYTANGFDLSWQKVLPKWRRALRRPRAAIQKVLPRWARQTLNGRPSDDIDGLTREDQTSSSVARSPYAPAHQQVDQTLGLLPGQCLSDMSFLSANFESYDLRAGNPVAALLHANRTGRSKRRSHYIYQLQ